MKKGAIQLDKEVIRPKPIKKSVSFKQDFNGSFANQTKHQNSESAIIVPKIKNPVIIIPIQNLLIIWALFYYGITSDVEGIMVKSFFTILPIHAIYNYILATNIVKKSKNDNNPLLVMSSILISILLSVPLFFVIILMGAPVYKYSFKTFTLSLHLSQLIFNPLLILYSLNLNQFKKLFEEDHVYYTIFSHPVLSQVLMALAGCWLGVIPIPLDWDRPWQQWPITLLIGGYIGGLFGNLISLVVDFIYRKN
ncbi:GPI11 [Candida pseudojiufengensis]|uniref:GPI11 n=1 Tax=Candida pseudojiufengensis TaxID=497109 RepID=UPI002225B242|nr:GPI11 [Candida pseudojiufengensis]KAI5959419.1 GPI11 [Candida pseudojiufengensis]